MRDRIFDLIFLIGVLFKGIDGLVEVIAGLILVSVSPSDLTGAAVAVTAGELSEDPHDIIANLLRHGVAHLDAAGVLYIGLYLLLHGVVKLAIVVALMIGSRRVFPWAIAALIAFVVFQIYEIITAPGIGVVALTIVDLFIIWLTWHEWRNGRELRDTWRDTVAWVFRHSRGTAG